jgi:hypothetical protein
LLSPSNDDWDDPGFQESEVLDIIIFGGEHIPQLAHSAISCIVACFPEAVENWKEYIEWRSRRRKTSDSESPLPNDDWNDPSFHEWAALDITICGWRNIPQFARTAISSIVACFPAAVARWREHIELRSRKHEPTDSEIPF